MIRQTPLGELAWHYLPAVFPAPDSDSGGFKKITGPGGFVSDVEVTPGRPPGGPRGITRYVSLKSL